ncbi:DUF1622 domain-containing protein [Sphingomonas jeddahensis]|uniref:DUF1622 domain-containing protein n=1 Tax=Sphingomonas jeddahensis TaxID=1915074 RepID=A0A1V2EQY2_9SPHN|nr:DUF1622 domain-containing protein [Sphingomonas jeddahensis]ONF95091.1 hypothetical protein SPHI_27210 [Sphingomonas jeddahensis]
MEKLHVYIELLAHALEIAGVAIIVIGVMLATAWFLRDGQRSDWQAAYERYRANLGRGILLGLELLVGADIIGTITAPLTFQSVGLLAIVVVIRTFLSFSLETEIEGCWPWQRRAMRARSAENDPER